MILIVSPDTVIKIGPVLIQKCPLERDVKNLQHVNQMCVYLQWKEVNQTGVHNFDPQYLFFAPVDQRRVEAEPLAVGGGQLGRQRPVLRGELVDRVGH